MRKVLLIDIRERRKLFSLAWPMSPATTVTAQLGAKDQFYCTVYYTTLNSSCEVQRISKNSKKKNLEDRVRSQN